MSSWRTQMVDLVQGLAAAEKAALGTAKESTMEDDPKKTALDRKFIAVDQEHEVFYWTNALGCTEQDLRKAVAAVGNSVEKVREYLAQ
jgi:hypothetical protein